MVATGTAPVLLFLAKNCYKRSGMPIKRGRKEPPGSKFFGYGQVPFPHLTHVETKAQNTEVSLLANYYKMVVLF